MKKGQVSEWIQAYYPGYYEMEDYPADRTVVVNKTDEEWGILGNFGRSPIVVDGVSFDCTERLFQIMKLSDPVIRRAVYAYPKNPWMKRVANKHEEAFRPDWGSLFIDALKFCLVTKYAQSEAFRTELARTGDRFIVEKNHGRPDSYCAVLSDDGTTWTGRNVMGRLLMELRDNGKLDYTLPEDIFCFRDLLEP